MYKSKCFILVIVLFSKLYITNAYSENKIVYLDIDYIISNINVGKILLEKLKDIENQKIEEFKIKENEFNNDEKKILLNKNIISQDAFNNNISELKKKIESYKNYKSQEIELIKKSRNKELLDLFNKINPIIEQFMKENQISIIIDKKNIFIADQNYDITNILVEEINKQFKK